MKVVFFALLMSLLLWAGAAKAQSCTATPTDIAFGSVSPISGAAISGSSTVAVNCTWPLISAQPFVQVCLNLNASSPRLLSNGSNTMQYDLYLDSAHSQSWGASATAISLSIPKPLLGTTAGQSVTYYGLIGANQLTVPSVANSNTVYSQSFSGTQTSLTYQFYTLSAPSCSSISTPATAFPFNATATVVNNCNISAGKLSFGTAGVLSSGLSATSTLSVQCTNGDAYRISLNGGGSGNVAARTMQRQGGGGSVNYQLYTDLANTVAWGDGSGGTSRATNTGTGNTQAITVYGNVPAQTTPMPGNYSDTITATIEF
ncbi:Csu type fimbrial protein [Dyella subtropica]|uniref:Csu type fimbrial protein n=1 Tax=Dyella subtropica TaxID=2992127 RepID=UPI0022504714|nr:spore coat U domain-containing protein [Dyella subtropica]